MLIRSFLRPCSVLCALASAAAAAPPWAVEVVSYDPGLTAVPGYTDPLVAMGPPERFTGEGVFPSVVSPFSPPFGTDEIVSIGEGGHLTLRFEAPIRNNPAHPFGVDLILFGNGGFMDNDWPNGVVGTPPRMFGVDDVLVEVSVDNVTYHEVGFFREGFFPTMGYLDSGPYDDVPGSIPTNFTLPVDPSLTLADFAGLDMDGIRALYAGSAGGTPIDLSSSPHVPQGLTFSYVRLSVPDDGDPLTALSAEIDAVIVVPAPGAGAILLVLGLLPARRR